jgi:integrase
VQHYKSDFIKRAWRIDAYFGVHQSIEKILKKLRFYVRVECHDELTFPTLRKGVHYRQKLLGHACVKTTMDRYVHVTDASLLSAIWQFAQSAS